MLLRPSAIIRSKILKGFLIFFTFIVAYFLLPQVAFAGFGITPSKISNSHLKPGSHFEKHITLSRSDPTENLQAIVETDLGEMEQWFSFNPGKKFILPAGEQQITLIIIVDIPTNVDYKNYNGDIRIKVSSIEKDASGISVVKGAKMEIAFLTTDIDLNALLIRTLTMQNTVSKEQLSLLMKVENQGNTMIGPTKVELEIFDLNNNLVAKLTNSNEINKVSAESTKEIEATFDAALEEGDYFVRVKAFYEEEILREEKLFLNILPTEEQVISANKTQNLLKIIKVGLALVITVILFALFRGFLEKTRMGSSVEPSEDTQTTTPTKNSFSRKTVIYIILLIVLFGTLLILLIISKEPSDDLVNGDVVELLDDESREIYKEEVRGISTELVDVSQPKKDLPNKGAIGNTKPLLTKNKSGKDVYIIFESPNTSSAVIYTATEDSNFFVYEELANWYRVGILGDKENIDGWVEKIRL